jgi:zinc transport system permease protein
MEIVITPEILLNSALAPMLLKAFIVGVLTAVCAAVLGVPLVMKRYSMIGDGLSHIGFFTLAVATLLGVPDDKQMLVTLPLVVLAAVVLLLLSESGKIKGDAAIAMFSTGAVALGYIIYSAFAQNPGDVCSSLFGASIMALDMGDVKISILLSVGVLLTFVLLFNKIFAVTFDPAFAAASGTRVSVYNVLIAVLTAVTIVVGMKMIGSVMISALIIFPALSAMRLCKRFKQVILLSALISLANFIIGYLFSATVAINAFGHEMVSLPLGPCVVCFNVLTLLLCMGYKAIGDRIRGKRAFAKHGTI